MRLHPGHISAIVVLSVVSSAASSQESPQRFDMKVREDFFTGMGGDAAAFQRAMRLCEARLKENPKDPEALVWHGSGLSFLSGQAAAAGEFEKAASLRRQGSAEMDEGVALHPVVETLVPRAATLLNAARRIPEPSGRRAVLRKAVADLEQVMKLEEKGFDQMCVHDRGELLGGLAEAWYQLDDRPKASDYLHRMVRELPDTAYARAANQTLEKPPDSSRVHVTCLGCHSTPSR